MIKYILRKIVSYRINSVYIKNHKEELVRFCKSAAVALSVRKGEKEFINKWKPLYKRVNVDFYRFYSNFCGEDPHILSDGIYHTIIEPLLNDPNALAVYGNKNMYELLMDREIFPICVIRNMNGDYYDRDYRLLKKDYAQLTTVVSSNQNLQMQRRFICKPTIETSGGNGVHLFVLDDNNVWRNEKGHIFSIEQLENEYQSDFIIQECIVPSAFVKQFNDTSYSTLRIFSYRSVKDDLVHFIGGYMRVGAKGSFIDNVWGGGYACPINDDGTLANFATDSKRKKYNNINGISLVEKTFTIPNFDKVMKLVEYVANKNIPNRLLSFDILLDEHNDPHVIEFNIKNQTVTTIQTSGRSFFGIYTDEVIEYCLRKKDSIKYNMSF